MISNNDELLTRIQILTSIMKLGHEAYERTTPQQVVNHIINNSCNLMKYERSCIFQISRKKAVAVSGQPKVNTDSPYINAISTLSEIVNPQRVIQLNNESLGAFSEKVREAFNEIQGDKEVTVYICPLPKPGSSGITDYYWIIESFSSNDAIPKILPLLSKHYSEALHYSLRNEKSSFLRKMLVITPIKFFLILLIAAGFSVFKFKVPLTAEAEFQVEPEQTFYTYSNRSGRVKTVFLNEGDEVKKGDLVIEIDTLDLQADLDLAEEELRELNSKHDLLEQTAFEKPKEMAQARLFKIKMEQQKIKIAGFKRKISSSKITAPATGVLVFKDLEKLTNKSIDEGELLFEIAGNDSVIEVLLNEKDALLAKSESGLELYFHAFPETAHKARIQEVSSRPERDINNRFSYSMMAAVKGESFKQGMRGKAVIKGDEIVLAEYLKMGIMKWWNQ